MTKRKFFDEIATTDALMLTPDERKKVHRLKRRLGNLEGLRVLEPGCGVGPLTEYLAEWAGPSGRVLAFDSSAAMVRECRRRLVGRRNVALRCAALEAIELESAAWDMALLFRVFPHFEDKPLALQRLRTCLVPGGRLVLANLEGSQRLNALHASFSEPVRGDCMPDVRATQRLIEEAGFSVVEPVIDHDEEFFIDARLPR